MKKTISVLLAAALLLVALAGCKKAPAPRPYTSDKEIVTYQRIDPEKTQLLVSRTGNIPAQSLCTAFEKENPDIQVVHIDITGGVDGCNPLEDCIRHGNLPDVVISAGAFADAQLTMDCFTNLSDDPILQNFQAAALQRTAVNANVYWLPGPSEVSAMMYNKTLFAQYGWEVPATFDQFVALCDQIRLDANGEIEPWNPNAKYSDELVTAIQAMTYGALFGGAENRIWYDEYVAGNAVFAGHLEPYMAVLQTLADHQILREEHFSYSATTRGKEFAAGKIAMISGSIFASNSDEYDFGCIPFPTTQGEVGYICDRYSCYVGVPIKERTPEKQDAVDRFLAYFSSQAGQEAYIGDTLKISNVKGVPFTQSDSIAGLQDAIQAGHMFARLGFSGPDGRYASVDVHDAAQNIVKGTMTVAECIAALDASLAADRENKAETEPAPEAVAVAAEDFSILETSFLIADAYRETARADLGLITHNEAYRGNLMRIYAGDISPLLVTVLKPRSFANDSTLVKLTMTGQQILDALNSPVGNEETANCIYAFSGLTCQVAPWNALGSKYLSVKLADGSALEPDKSYTVACWAGTVPESCVTQPPNTFEGSWEDMMTAYLQGLETVAPKKDGRITLVWD